MKSEHMELTPEARKKKAEYLREWRAKNPGKQREYDQRKWEKKAMESKDYRINLKLPKICKHYLREVSWRNRTSVTGYILNLIREDMDKNKKIVEELIESKYE